MMKNPLYIITEVQLLRSRKWKHSNYHWYGTSTRESSLLQGKEKGDRPSQANILFDKHGAMTTEG